MDLHREALSRKNKKQQEKTQVAMTSSFGHREKITSTRRWCTVCICGGREIQDIMDEDSR